MIIGIDEVGNFDPNSDQFNYFTAVLIDQNLNKYNIKESQFILWEDKVPKDSRDDKGEVKGQKLTNELLESFYYEVLRPKPSVLYSVVRIKPSENKLVTIEDHHKKEIESFEKALQYYKDNPRGNWAEGYEKILAWYKNRKPAHLLKMKCLQRILGITLNHGMAWAQLMYMLDKNDATNIKNFAYKIDKDFIRAENVKIIWNEILRQFWQEFSKRDKIPLVDFGINGQNPVKREYGAGENKSNLKKVFRDRTHFLNSEEHFEVRMADIFGTILHRFHNKGECEKIYKEIEKHLGGKKNNYLHLVLNEVK